MSEHVGIWINAYLDEELLDGQKRMVEAHLATCADCQSLLAQQQKMASLIRELPPALNVKPAQRFAAEVVQALQGIQRNRFLWPRELRILQLGWLAIPVALLLATIFVKAVGFLSTMIALLPGSKPIFVQVFSMLTPPIGLSLDQPWNSLFGGMVGFNFGQWSIITGLVVSIATGLLYLAWIASWFTSYQDVIVDVKDKNL